MTYFRVYGRKQVDFYVDVEASDEYEAMEIANNLPTDRWSEIEGDKTIESYETDDREEMYSHG